MNPPDRYYAIVAEDETGSAHGIGTTRAEAWANAETWGLDDREGLKSAEITEASFKLFEVGQTDTVEIIKPRTNK